MFLIQRNSNMEIYGLKQLMEKTPDIPSILLPLKEMTSLVDRENRLHKICISLFFLIEAW